ncbi:MAG: type II toxin-antitoxin system Phd/YefM family antitoxin [Fimbriimonas sp.]
MPIDTIDLARNLVHNRTMIRVNVHEAKTSLSKLLKLVASGETVQICSRNTPVAELKAVDQPPATGTRPKPNLPEGQIQILDSFYEPMSEEELAEWYEGDIFPVLEK